MTAMVCRDLGSVPEPRLPAGLTVRPVRRVPEDPADGVPLTDAVAVAARAAPAGEASPDALTAYLRSLPGDPRLFAAVDQDGVVRARADHARSVRTRTPSSSTLTPGGAAAASGWR